MTSDIDVNIDHCKLDYSNNSQFISYASNVLILVVADIWDVLI